MLLITIRYRTAMIEQGLKMYIQIRPKIQNCKVLYQAYKVNDFFFFQTFSELNFEKYNDGECFLSPHKSDSLCAYWHCEFTTIKELKNAIKQAFGNKVIYVTWRA